MNILKTRTYWGRYPRCSSLYAPMSNRHYLLLQALHRYRSCIQVVSFVWVLTIWYSDWATSLSLFTFMHWRRKWQSTPVFLPGESQGRGILVGCSPWSHKESDTTERLYWTGSKEIKLANPKGNQLWKFIGRADAEAPILWPPEAKSQFIGEDLDAGKPWRQKEKRVAENENG